MARVVQISWHSMEVEGGDSCSDLLLICFFCFVFTLCESAGAVFR